MSSGMSTRVALGALGGLVVAMAGVGGYLQASLGGPGTTAFVVRLLLVSIALVGAILLGLALRMPAGVADLNHSASPAPPDRER